MSPASSSDDFTSGRPLFASREIQALADSAGPLAAWRQLLSQGDLRAALASTGGSFALGLTLADGRRLLAVDRFSVEKLCYRLDQGQLSFHPRADHWLSQGDARLSAQSLYEYLYFHVVASPHTVFEGVSRLPAAHYALFQNGQLQVQPYWTPAFQPARGASFASLKSELLTALEGAVRDQLEPGGQPACFLSGGIDSSTVAGMMGRVSGRKVATYSIGFDAEGYDEMAYARLAAKHFGCEPHEYYVTPDDLLKGMHKIAEHYDQPFGNSSALPAYYCALMAREQGVTRLLAGDGGDELFDGNARYAKQKLFAIYDRVPGWLKAGLEPLLLNPLAARTPLLSKAGSYVSQARVPLPDRTQTYNLLSFQGVDKLLAPEFLAAVAIDGPLQQQREVWAQIAASHVVDHQLAFDWYYTLAETDLPKVCGATTMAGVSTGFPMLDLRLLEVSLKLKPEDKVKGQQLRWFFKEALRGFLPDEIIVKKKQGFGLPFGVWTKNHDGLNRMARDNLASLDQRGILRRGFSKTLMDELLPAHPGYYGELVWILLMLEQWLQAKLPAYRFQA